MTDSLIQASQKARWWKKIPWWEFLALAIFLVGIWWVWAASSSGQGTSEGSFTQVERGDIVVSVEGEGKIINPNLVNLSFFVNGTLQEVNVEVGDLVKKGDIIAQLDPRDFRFDLKDAQSQVSLAWANIQSKESELTDQSLRLAKDDLVSSQQNLAQARRDHEQALRQTYDGARVDLENFFPSIESALRSVDEIFAFDRQIAQYENVVQAFHDSIRENRVRNLYFSSKLKRDTLWKEYQALRPLSERAIPDFLRKAEAVSSEVQDLLEETLILFDGAVPSGFANQSLISSAESPVKSALSSISGELSGMMASRQSIENAELSYKNGMEDAERSLENTQLRLENTERDYDRAEVSKKNSLAGLYAQLSQAQVRVEKAQYNLDLTTLVAPIDGEIVALNGKPGETIKAETASSDNAFVKILSQENFTIEVYIEEVDIARIRKDQPVIITLDAIEGVELEGRVDYVSSLATIENNGVTTYLVEVEITDTKDAPIREGMTAYVEFIEHQALNALVVPTSSVLNDRWVFDETGTRISVRVGISGDGKTEIFEGLSEGQKIMSRPPSGSQGEGRSRGPRNTEGGNFGGGDVSVEERMQRIGERMRENGTLPAGWDDMSTAQKQKALEEMRQAGGGGGFGGGPRGGFGSGGRR